MRPFASRGVAQRISRVGGLRPTVALPKAEGELPMYQMIQVEEIIGLPLRPMLTNGENLTLRWRSLLILYMIAISILAGVSVIQTAGCKMPS